MSHPPLKISQDLNNSKSDFLPRTGDVYMNNDSCVHEHIAMEDKWAFVFVHEILLQCSLICYRSHAMGTRPPSCGM